MKNKVILALGIGLAAVLAPSIGAEAAATDLPSEMSVDDLDSMTNYDEITEGNDKDGNGVLQNMDINRYPENLPNIDPNQTLVSSTTAPTPETQSLLAADVTITNQNQQSFDNLTEQQLKDKIEELQQDEEHDWSIGKPVVDEDHSDDDLPEIKAGEQIFLTEDEANNAANQLNAPKSENNPNGGYGANNPNNAHAVENEDETKPALPAITGEDADAPVYLDENDQDYLDKVEELKEEGYTDFGTTPNTGTPKLKEITGTEEGTTVYLDE
ncbi:hypothetical protein SAMN02910292_02259, partial [Lachnospiraceae bacterium XBB2008]